MDNEQKSICYLTPWWSNVWLGENGETIDWGRRVYIIVTWDLCDRILSKFWDPHVEILFYGSKKMSKMKTVTKYYSMDLKWMRKTETMG